MAVTALRTKPSLRDRVSEEEWQLRTDLAALYRLVAKHGMTDGTATHLSARLPGPDHHFLLNPHGLLFDQVTASNLVRVDMDGNVLEGEYPVNAAGFCIHSAVHMARPDVVCVAHTHTAAGMALSALPQGLMALTQKSMRYYGRTAYHDYEGIALDLDERDRLIADLGETNHTMILRNHGVLVMGPSVRLTWTRLYTLEKTMRVQLAAMASGGTLLRPSEELCRHVAAQWDKGDETYRQDGWESQLRLLDRADPAWRH